MWLLAEQPNGQASVLLEQEGFLFSDASSIEAAAAQASREIGHPLSED